MSEAVQRRPALGQRVDPVQAAIPERQTVTTGHAGSPSPAPLSGTGHAGGEALNTVLNTRIKASTRSRLELAVNKLRFEQNDRSISLASLTDRALDSFLRDLGV